MLPGFRQDFTSHSEFLGFNSFLQRFFLGINEILDTVFKIWDGVDGESFGESLKGILGRYNEEWNRKVVDVFE